MNAECRDGRFRERPVVNRVDGNATIYYFFSRYALEAPEKDQSCRLLVKDVQVVYVAAENGGRRLSARLIREEGVESNQVYAVGTTQVKRSEKR